MENKQAPIVELSSSWFSIDGIPFPMYDNLLK